MSEFKIIPFTHDNYIACSDGYVITPTGIFPRQIRLCGNYYPVTHIPVNGKKIAVPVHRIIAITFIPNPQNKPYVNHLDRNKMNSRKDNLEWVTSKENAFHYQQDTRNQIAKFKIGSEIFIPSSQQTTFVKYAHNGYLYFENGETDFYDNIVLINEHKRCEEKK